MSARRWGVFLGLTMLGTLALLQLGGCASTAVDCADFRAGNCRLQTVRFLTDTSATVQFPGQSGGSASVTSKPNDQATASAFQLAHDSLGVAGAALKVGGAATVPLALP